MDSIFNKKIAPDPSDEIMTICADPPCKHMSEEIMGSKIHSYRNPYDLSAPPMPGNYLDFMNLVYIAIENDTIDNIPYLKKKIDVRNVRDLFTRHYGEYCLARRGLKYFSFYSLAKAENRKDFFINTENIVKEFTNAGTDIQNIFLLLDEKIKNDNTTLSELLDKDFNNCLSLLTLSTIKLEEILKMKSYKSLLGFKNNINNNKDENIMENNNEFFGHQHDLYQYLVSILKSVDETLKNPKIPEGMVTREELALALSKIIPGVSEDELAKILKNYSTQNEVELRLVNYVLKSDFENRLSSFIAKADASKFVTSEQAQDYAKKTEIIEQFAKYYDRQIIDTLVKNLPSRDEIDLKLQGYLLKSDYKQFDGYTRDEIDKLLRNTIDYDKLYVELKKYLSLQAADSVLENYSRKDQVEAAYLKKQDAEALYAKKGEVPVFDKTGLASEEYVKNAINQAKLDAAGQQVDLSIYDTKEGVKAKIVEAKAEIGTSVDSKINQSKGELLNVINTKADSQTLNTTFAKKSEIPSVANFITGSQVDQKIIDNKNAVMTVVDQKILDLANKSALFTQVGNNKLIRLGNGDSISAYKASGAESANLLRLSTDDKIEIGSTAVNINFNGFNAHPTYNNKDIVLVEDLAKTEKNISDVVATKLDRSVIEVNLSGISGVLPDSKAIALYVSQKIAEAKLEGQNVDLSAYAGKSYVDEKVGVAKAEIVAGVDVKINGAVDAAKDELNIKIADKINKSEVEEKYAKIDTLPNISGLATKEEVKTATEKALTSEDADKVYAKIDAIPDITGLAEKAALEAKLDKTEAETTYAKIASVPTQEVIDNKLNISDADVKYATKEENKLNLTKAEATTTYASQDWVTNKINEAQLGGAAGGQAVDLSAYALNTSVDTKIENAKNELNIAIGTKLTEDQANEKYAKKGDVPDTTTLATKDEVAQKLTQDQADALYAKIDAIPETDGLATKVELEAKLDKTEAETTYAKKAELPDTSLLATKEELTEKIKDAQIAGGAYDDTEIKAELAKKVEQTAIDAAVADQLSKTEAATTYATKEEIKQKADQSALTDLEAKITALESKIAELTKKIVTEHPKTEEATTLTVNPTEINDLKMGGKESDTLTFESNAKSISLAVKENAAADVVEIQLTDKVATITALKEGTTTLVAKAKAEEDIDHTYTEKSIEINITVAAAYVQP